MIRRRHLTTLIGCLSVLALPGVSVAHDARPLSLLIVEQTPSVYRAIIQIPPTIEAANRPRVIWPEACAVVEGGDLGASTTRSLLVSCADGLAGKLIRLAYPYYNPSITALIRLQTTAGTPITAVLPPDTLSWLAPAAPTAYSVARDYLRLGFRHIWGGIDHLLFVAGLLLLARRIRKIVWAITGFTAAHSLTLSLAALGVARPPVTLVEAMIALSILFLAVEIARDEETTFSHNYPIVLSFVFGLLHGFGFAGALGDIGLPRNEVVTGLLFFNLGVELGQLSFIAAVVVLAAGARRLWSRLPSREKVVDLRPALPGAYCLGVPAAFWFFERTATAFAG